MSQSAAARAPRPERAPAALPDDLRYHVYNADGRSLCDQRAIPDLDRAHGAARPTGAQKARVCGPCVVVAQELLYLAKSLIYEFGEPTPSPPEALAELAQVGSRWPLIWDLDQIARDYSSIGYRYPWFAPGSDVPQDSRGGESGQSASFHMKGERS